MVNNFKEFSSLTKTDKINEQSFTSKKQKKKKKSSDAFLIKINN